MATMKEVCDIIEVSYETLRFYCNEGLVPDVKRGNNNHRIFDERDVNWLLSLMHLKKRNGCERYEGIYALVHGGKVLYSRAQANSN